MKKYIISISVSLTMFSLAMILFLPIQNVQAQTLTSVVCPTGYTCKPIKAQPVNCPMGYICEPVGFPDTPVSTPISTPVKTIVPVPSMQPCPIFSMDIGMNSSGPDVVALQEKLISKGFDIPAISSGRASKGYFGSQTAEALKKFQQSENETATGILTSSTRQKINSITGCVLPPTPAVISEQVKCVFAGATTEQKCSGVGQNTIANNGAELFAPQFQCSGVGSCVAKISISDIAKGMGLSWSSSCGGDKSPITTIDGNDEYANFNCGTSNNQPPVISGLDAPTKLSVGQMGTWTVKAYDPENGQLSYSVTWGDEYKTAGGQNTTIEPSIQLFSQKTSFTHSYSSAGVYTVNVAVKDNTGLTSQTIVTVNVGTVTASGITVISPNGGESWQKGTTQTIKWQDNTPIPKCPEGAYCTLNSQIMKTYDIKILPYQSCSSQIGVTCLPYYPSPYVIANRVIGSSYIWNVGNVADLYDARIGDGLYTIQVCQSGTSVCDLSDSSFKIFSN